MCISFDQSLPCGSKYIGESISLGPWQIDALNHGMPCNKKLLCWLENNVYRALASPWAYCSRQYWSLETVKCSCFGYEQVCFPTIFFIGPLCLSSSSSTVWTFHYREWVCQWEWTGEDIIVITHPPFWYRYAGISTIWFQQLEMDQIGRDTVLKNHCNIVIYKV